MCCSHPPSTLSTTLTTNESQQLAGAVTSPSQPFVVTRWWLFSPSRSFVNHHDHQRVATTHWCIVLTLLALHQPPTSHHDSLVSCSRPPGPLSTTTTTNESRRLVGALFSPSQPFVNYQRVPTTRWCVSLVLPALRRPPPMTTTMMGGQQGSKRAMAGQQGVEMRLEPQVRIFSLFFMFY